MNGDIEKAWVSLEEAVEAASHRWRVNVNRRTLIVLAAISLPIFVLYITLLMPPADFPTEEIVSVPRGVSAREVALAFQEEGLVRSSAAFELTMRIVGGDKKLHAGDYQFKRPKNAIRVAWALMAGDFGIKPVRVLLPSGATVEEMASILDKKLIRFDREAFVDQALPYEGYLYPNTYFFLPTAQADVVVQTLRETFDREVMALTEEIEVFGKSREEVVIMASLLEREESNYEDKRKIAGVLWKRLDINMPLQVDATFVYIIGKGSNQLTLEDLQYDSPYNTYRNKGLPPGPIANPSIDSIRAAINPAEHTYLFYLADRYGKTYYSATYEEHLRKKRYYLGS
jgi:UPF0755 protein